MESLWIDTCDLKHFDDLNGDIKTDVLIVGGGLAGILTAYMLDSAGVDYILIEAGRIFDGVSKFTTAKITAQHGLIYNKLTKEFGKEKASLYLSANLNALKQYSTLCQKNDCDFEFKDSFVYSTTENNNLEKEITALDSIGYKAYYEENTELPIYIKGAVKFPRQAEFNPAKFVSQLSSKLKIYENTKALSYNGDKIITNNGSITAKNTVITTHFPLFNKHGSYFLKMYQDRSYVIALEDVKPLNGMYVDCDNRGFSFRSYNNFLILGGNGHRTGKKGVGWSKLDRLAQNCYPNSIKKYRWATQDCMTLDGVPYIGRYSKSTPNLFVATGFNKWGITSSMIASEILRDLILERKNPYFDIFSPSRTILRPQLLINGFETITNLVTPTVKRCPHMGCALKWNPYEKSWDCPCHGSRFSNDGKLINNPATDDLKNC